MSESNVRSFDSAIILDQFFGNIFGEQQGWVYTATKVYQEDGKGDWEKHFFRYPDNKAEMIKFIIISSAEKDVYYSPAIFSANRSSAVDKITKEDFKGTNFVWADFDGHLPDAEKLSMVPAPTMKVRSSNSDRQHWYWNLNFIEQDPDALEKITRALTYHLGADLSGWDYQQVLRPPGTIHHKSGKTVTILEATNSKVSIEAFLDIPEVPDYVWDVDIDETKVEPPLKVYGRYAIPSNDIDLILKKSVEIGKRSSALTRVGYVCAEAGMTNVEIFSMLKFCDNKWGKFKERGEQSQKKNLIGIIRYVRQKFPLHIKENPEDELPYFTFGEFSSMDIQVEWIVENLIQKNGLPTIVGPSNVGKTHLTFQIACHMVLGKKFLTWEFARPMTICIASLELAPAETKEELIKIIDTFTPEEQAIIAKNLHVIPLGSRITLDKVKDQDKLLRRLEQYKPEGVFFDSLGHSISSGLTSDDVINDMFDFVKRRINQNYDAFSWFIHHMRKGQVGNKKPKDPDDIFGSAYIANNATTIVSLWKNAPADEIAEFNYLKVRFGKFPPNFKVKRRDPCGFDIVSGHAIDLDTGEDFKSNEFNGIGF